MRLTCVAALGAALLLPTLVPVPAGAQGIVVKKKVLSQDQYQKMMESGTRAVLGGETLHNGDYVSVQRKGDQNRLNGVFVYEDAKGQKIYVRPQPNAAPVGVALKEIEEIDRIVPANTQKQKGGVRFATDDVSGPPPREIHILQVYNGAAKEIRFYGPTLSAAEKQELAALEKAANELAVDEEAAQSLERTLADPRGDTPAPQRVPASPGFAWDYYTNSSSPFMSSPFGYSPFMMPFMMGGASPTINVQLPSTPAPAPSMAEQQKSLSAARERVEKDRQAYQATRARAIFDNDGAIVAVRLDEK